jgi:RimJ/RimL family protein N-acetyltransferase
VHPPASIELPGVRLRRWSASDAPALRAALAENDAHLRAWTPWVIDGREPGLSLEERLARHAAGFDAGTEWVYGLFDRAETEVLGGVGLYPRVGPRAVELGYWLAARHTGRGLATVASAALTALAFASPDVGHVEIRCERRNAASARVPERLGYTLLEPSPAGVAPEMMVWRMSREGWLAREGPALG